MNLLKFNKAGDDIYIDADKVTAVTPSIMYDGGVNIYTTGGDFIVKGNADDIARYIMTSTHEDHGEISPRAAEMLEKRCGLCKHYEIGKIRQCRKHIENRSEDDKVCHFYEP